MLKLFPRPDRHSAFSQFPISEHRIHNSREAYFLSGYSAIFNSNPKLRYFRAGRYIRVDKTLYGDEENDAKLTLNTVAGQPYFVWQEVKMGLFSPRSKLHLMNQQAGEKGVLECKLARPGKAGK